MPVRRDGVLAPEGELPAHVGLELKGRYAPFEGGPVQGAADPTRVPGAVQEDAGAADKAGGDGPLRVAL